MYLASYAQLDHVKDRSFVVAVTNFDQPFSFMTCQRPIEAVLLGYYVDEERYVATGGQEGRLEGEPLLQVFKDNDNPVELGMFTTPAYREISAVIFSSCATMGKVRAMSSDPNPNIVFTALRLNPNSDRPHIIKKPKRRYEENLLDGLRVYYNPFAAHPLDPSVFRPGLSSFRGSMAGLCAPLPTLAIAADPKRLGARIGITAVLHTWGSTLHSLRAAGLQL